VLAPGQSLLRVIEDGAMEFRVGLPPETAAQLAPGRRYAIGVDGQRLPATLDTVVPSVEPDTRTVTAVLSFEEPPEAIGNGALGRLDIETERSGTGLWLPITALTEGRRGLWSAYAVVGDADGGSRVERRELQLLHVESDRAFVRGTLEDGERVVATGLHRLVPGQRVRVVE
jgi:multidrug efflux pump subunit AcrA (membrane-fusion protein)